MDYQDFITIVQQVAGIADEQAERVVCPALQTLAQRISKGEAADLAGRVPDRLRSCLQHEGPRSKISLDEFLQRIEQEAATDRPAAEKIARGMFAALWSAVGAKEFFDMRSELPEDFQPLLDEAVDLATKPPLYDELPPARMSAQEFLDRVARRGLGPEHARPAAETVLETLAMRITGGQVEDLIPLVPRELRPALRRGMSRSEARGMSMSLDEFLEEIARRERVTKDEALRHARIVFAVLHETIGDKEFNDVVAQLPNEYRALLLQEFA
ncbi:DUF2267 domain-containing protein [Pseudonocardia bannensis]|uniref:DUF2267 domain-containing protein n=1 Tax=Pseudonocardia bannensis TaxID=630973 RepID=A0A848DLB7_9PSEU|nr:DUF2267 domain-containing protein [Pseudonocardia bannensis]NMH93194.1 DUF2267 domain-containing protein [Pseudonocardia bannensis]